MIKFDTPYVAARIQSRASPKTRVMPYQNALGIYKAIGGAFYEKTIIIPMAISFPNEEHQREIDHQIDHFIHGAGIDERNVIGLRLMTFQGFDTYWHLPYIYYQIGFLVIDPRKSEYVSTAPDSD